MLSSICGSPPSPKLMSSSRRKLIPLLLLALVTGLVAVACGSDESDEGSKAVPAGAIALVGEQAIPKEDFDRLLEQARANYEAQGQEFPEPGTPDHEELKGTLIRSLVQQAQWAQAGAAMGLKVTDEEIDAQLASFKEQYFKDDEEAYEAELVKQEVTEDELRERIAAKLLSDKIYAAIIKKAAVTDAEIQAYYEKNKAQYQQPESREVCHILVEKEALADEIHAKIVNGADFAALAEKYSTDSSASEGGKYTAYRGKSVAPFEEFVYGAETGDLSKPIKTQFGWHVIEVLGDIQPPSTQPLEEARESIETTLLQEEQNTVLEAWVKETEEKYAAVYAPGYAPPPAATETGIT